MKRFIKPEITIAKFEVENILTLSNGGTTSIEGARNFKSGTPVDAATAVLAFNE